MSKIQTSNKINMRIERQQFTESKNPNIDHKHPLKVFSIDMVGLLVSAVALFVVAGVLASTIVYWLPFSVEKNRLGPIADQIISTVEPHQDAKLQALADSLAAKMGIEHPVEVYISDLPVPNAFATFGGKIVLMRGLIEQAASEETIAMVLAHELAHIRQRDPLKAGTRGMLIETTKALTIGNTAFIDYGIYAGHMSYSRQQESRADAMGLEAVVAHYGSSKGALELYDILAAAHPKNSPQISWLSSHPDTEARTRALAKIIDENHYDQPKSLRPNIWQKSFY